MAFAGQKETHLKHISHIPLKTGNSFIEILFLGHI